MREFHPCDKHNRIPQTCARQAEKNTFLAPEFICEFGKQHGANGAAEVIYCDDDADDGGLLGYAHGGEVVFVRVDERHHALVVAVQGNGCGAEHDDVSLFVVVGLAEGLGYEGHGGWLGCCVEQRRSLVQSERVMEKGVDFVKLAI